MDRSPVHHRADIETQETSHAHIHTHGRLDTNWPSLYLFGLWEEAETSGGNLHKRGDNMHTDYKGAMKIPV